MLFQRLYNWIKYKTLPPSVLFKNRLFIERDSKHRRIFSNLGLTFRSAKWSNYEMYNLKSQFQWFYFRFLFWIISFAILGFVTWNFSSYYISYYFFNTVSFLFWMSIDTFDYYLSFSIWMTTFTMSMVANMIYSYFFFNNFAKKKDVNKYFTNRFFTDMRLLKKLSDKEKSLKREELSWILYSWVINPNSVNHDLALEEVFNIKQNKLWWDTYYDFFIKLFKLTHLLNLTNVRFSIFGLDEAFRRISLSQANFDRNGFLSYLNNNKLTNEYAGITLWYILSRQKNYFNQKLSSSKSLNYLNQKFEWNLYNFHIETEKYNYLLKTRAGLFFFANLNFKDLSKILSNYPELWPISDFLKNQTNAAKWNRWLYKYSILHRKILKNSHKITVAKRLLNSGFYDTKLFNKNIWASETLKKYTVPTFLNNTFNVYYNSFFKPITFDQLYIRNPSILQNSSSYNNLNLLKFYENSYFWFLKRFYFFNTLASNKIKSSVALRSDKISVFTNERNLQNSSVNNYLYLTSYLTKSIAVNFASISNLEASSDSNFSLAFNSYFQNSKNYNFKDTYLLFEDNDIFSQDNLDVLYWLTSASINSNLRLFFFNYLSTLGYLNNNLEDSKFFKIKSSNEFELSYWLLFPLETTDLSYLNDLYCYTLFY